MSLALLRLKTFILQSSLAATLVLGGCSNGGLGNLLGGGDSPTPAAGGALSPGLERSDDQAVAGLYNEGLNNINNGSYSAASKKFAEVERLHPYSKWATKALLMQGFANYQANKYGDAINACQRFISLHPGHKDISYAYYLTALSQYEQIADVTRDQSQTQTALDALDEVSRRFPADPSQPNDSTVTRASRSISHRFHLAVVGCGT